MSERSRRFTIFSVGGLFAVLVLVAVVVLVLVVLDAESYRTRIQTLAAKALGAEVQIEGPVRIRIGRGLHVVLQDVRVRNRGKDIGFAPTAGLGLALVPLLSGRLRVSSILLYEPTLSIERGVDGTFNLQGSATRQLPRPVLEPVQIAVADGTIDYADKLSGHEFQARDCNLRLHGLLQSGERPADLLQRVSFSGSIACDEIQRNGLEISNLALLASGTGGIWLLEQVTMEIFGGQGTGHLRADYASSVPRYDVLYSLPNFQIEAFFASLSQRRLAEGLVTFTADLSMDGKSFEDVLRSVNGRLSLRGEDLTLFGSDIDETYSRYESSQSFNLADLGAFFFAGPLGVVVTKGYQFASIPEGAESSSTIRTLVSDWNVDGGVAEAQDVAMATNENRIALKGLLDLVNETFIDTTVAVVDSDGCVKVDQKIRGTFAHPVVEQPNVAQSLIGPALDLLRKGAELVSGGRECEAFYTGSVPPPS